MSKDNFTAKPVFNSHASRNLALVVIKFLSKCTLESFHMIKVAFGNNCFSEREANRFKTVKRSAIKLTLNHHQRLKFRPLDFTNYRLQDRDNINIVMTLFLIELKLLRILHSSYSSDVDISCFFSFRRWKTSMTTLISGKLTGSKRLTPKH